MGGLYHLGMGSCIKLQRKYFQGTDNSGDPQTCHEKGNHKLIIIDDSYLLAPRKLHQQTLLTLFINYIHNLIYYYSNAKLYFYIETTQRTTESNNNN